MARDALHPVPIRSRLQTGAHVFLLVILPALVFANTLHNGYHLDDVYRVLHNPEIERVWPPWRHFLDPLTGTTKPQLAAYRPLMPLSHSLDVALSKRTGVERVVIFHLGNIVLHIATALMLYLLFRELLVHWSRLPLPHQRLPDIAFSAALLFAVHPISGVPVNSIGGRDLLLMMVFLTASLLVYVRMRREGDSGAGWCAALGLMSLSLLSKENATVAFAVVFLFEVVLAGTRFADWRLWARVAAFGAASAGYFAARWFAWTASTGAAPALGAPAGTSYPLTQLKVHLFHHMKNVAWPFEMRPLPRIAEVESLRDIYALSGAAFILATLALAWFLRTRSPLAAFSIVGYWVLLAPSSSVLAFYTVARDHRPYASLAFLFLALCIALFTLLRHRVEIGLVGALVLYLGLSSVFMNRVWRDEESFWAQSVRYGGTAMAHANYGLAVVVKDPELAERHYREAIRLYPNHVYAHINLGMLYIEQGRGEEGLALVRRVVSPDPDWAMTHYWLSKALGRLGRDAEALVAMRRAADLKPRNLDYQYEAAAAAQAAGDAAGSLPYIELVTADDPGYRDALFLLGIAQQDGGRRALAIDSYRRLLRDRPDHVQARFNLGYALMKSGKCDEAVTHFERVLALQPGKTVAHRHLSICYRALGDEARAAKHQALYER